MSDNKQFERLRQLLSGGCTDDECLFYECNDNLIIIGANKQQIFKLPISIKRVKKLLLVYTQNNNIIIKKILDNLKIADFDDSLIYFDLLENDTLKFKEGKVNAQLKVLLDTNDILVSNELEINAIKTLDNLKFNIDNAFIESLQAIVNDQDIKLIQFSNVSSGSNKTHYCRFIFDSSWDDLDKKAIFKDEYNNYIDDVDIDKISGICKIPKSIISNPGNIYVGVVGSIGNVVRPTEWSNSIRVSKSCTYNGFLKEEENEYSLEDDIIDIMLNNKEDYIDFEQES